MKKRSVQYSLLLVSLMAIMLIPAVSADRHLYLLAVEESASGSRGSIADLYLKTTEGNGQVFTATYPLTEMDTQISARLAKEIACRYAKDNCNRDFMYTIKSNSSIVGGPSGGAALTIITVSELLNQDIDESIAITGTINTGGIIGPVGGIKEKIKAAADLGLKTVLIPKGTRFFEAEEKGNITLGNKTINVTISVPFNTSNATDLIEYGNSLGINVYEVGTIDEAYHYFINKEYVEKISVPNIDTRYKDTMKLLSEMLCNRSRTLKEGLSGKLYQEGINYTEKADESIAKQEYYSAASYCFGANTRFLQLTYENLSYVEIQQKAYELNKRENRMKVPDYASINDLQIFMIVKERLFETNNIIEKINKTLEKAKTNYSLLNGARENLALANERLASVDAWAQFYDGEQNFAFSKSEMKDACIKKLAEAEERYQYVKIYFPDLLRETLSELVQAKRDMVDEQYELCLFKSAKAKADADALLSAMGVTSEYMGQMIDEKLKVVGQILNEQKAFPIVAYSYYEYANNLRHDDVYSSLLYTEYALELADLSPYITQTDYKISLTKEKKVIVLMLVLVLMLASLWFIGRKR
jgi:uncharacterized protein